MRFLIFFSIVLGIWLAFHLYVGWRLWSLPLIANPTGHRILLLGLAVLYVSYPLGRYLYHHGFPRIGTVLEYGGGVWMGTLVLLLSALGIVDLVTLFGLVLKPWVVQMRTAAICAALLLAVVAWIGGIVRPRTVDLEVELPNLPASADGLVVAHLTDLHLGALIGERRLQSVIEQIDGMNPDIVVVTGDLVDGDAGTVESMVPVLKTLTAPRGVYSILGNHEMYAGFERCRDLMRDSGFVVLDSAAAQVVPGLWIAGVPDSGRGPGTDGLEGALQQAFSGVGEGDAVVFLQHSPGNEEATAAAGAGLMLNGHTHGGQIWPFHYMVLRTYPHIAGVHEVDGMTQVISRGAGRWGAPMRLFAPSEIYRITLRSPEKKPLTSTRFRARLRLRAGIAEGTTVAPGASQTRKRFSLRFIGSSEEPCRRTGEFTRRTRSCFPMTEESIDSQVVLLAGGRKIRNSKSEIRNQMGGWMTFRIPNSEFRILP